MKMRMVTICMGSSCFSRGNSMVAEAIQRFVTDKGLQDRVSIRGCLCEGECKSGPNIRIDDTLYANVSADTAVDIISRQLEVEP